MQKIIFRLRKPLFTNFHYIVPHTIFYNNFF